MLQQGSDCTMGFVPQVLTVLQKNRKGKKAERGKNLDKKRIVARSFSLSYIAQIQEVLKDAKTKPQRTEVLNQTQVFP